jgi:hypothetical protein
MQNKANLIPRKGIREKDSEEDVQLKKKKYDHACNLYRKSLEQIKNNLQKFTVDKEQMTFFF